MSANSILIIGESGSGKSSSIRTLDPKETFIINVSSKPLPFKGWKGKYTAFNKSNPQGNLLNTDKTDVILATLKHISDNRPEIKNVIVDDSQYTVVNEYMSRIKDSGFQKFADMASNMFKIPKLCQELRDDLYVFFLSHSDIDTEDPERPVHKAKTIGKMMNKTVTYEGLFSIVLFADKREVKDGVDYGFITNGDPKSTAKSPMGMFESTFVPNDLALVVNAIKDYEKE